MARRGLTRIGDRLFALLAGAFAFSLLSSESARAWPAAAFTEEAFARGLNYYIPVPPPFGQNPNGSGWGWWIWMETGIWMSF